MSRIKRVSVAGRVDIATGASGTGSEIAKAFAEGNAIATGRSRGRQDALADRISAGL